MGHPARLPNRQPVRYIKTAALAGIKDTPHAPASHMMLDALTALAAKFDLEKPPKHKLHNSKMRGPGKGYYTEPRIVG